MIDKIGTEWINPAEPSEWSCLMFGASPSNGILWRPVKGKEPNFFWRWMQYICFGNKWIKDEETK